MAKDGVEFEDFTIPVIGTMNQTVLAELEALAGELEAQTKRNTRWKIGNVKTENGWQHYIDESEQTAYIGNAMEAALWEEFGTGSHAINGNGRKGYWVYVEGGDPNAKKSTKQYTLEEAKKAVAFLRSEGLEAYYTNGREAVRPFFKAYNAMKNVIVKRLQAALNRM